MILKRARITKSIYGGHTGSCSFKFGSCRKTHFSSVFSEHSWTLRGVKVQNPANDQVSVGIRRLRHIDMKGQNTVTVLIDIGRLRDIEGERS